MEETSSWGDILTGAWDRYIDREREKDYIALQEKQFAQQNPIYLTNADGTTVRAGTTNPGATAGINPTMLIVMVAALGGVLMLARR